MALPNPRGRTGTKLDVIFPSGESEENLRPEVWGEADPKSRLRRWKNVVDAKTLQKRKGPEGGVPQKLAAN